MANMVEGGKTPLLSKEDLSHIGLRLVVYANTTNRVSVLAVQNVLSHLEQHGSMEGAFDQIITWEERQCIVALSKFEKIEVKYRSDGNVKNKVLKTM